MSIEINMNDFLKHFEKMYEFLSENQDNVTGFKEAVEIGSTFIESHEEFVAEFVKYREDFLSSDREVAAFAFALCDFI